VLFELVLIGVELASQIDILGPSDAAGRPEDALGAGAQAGSTCRVGSVALCRVLC
jgi:hypothetical protein